MGDVLVDNPVNTIPPHKRLPHSDSIPNIDSLEGSGNDSGDEYATLKRYQRHLEYISLQEEYIKDEQRSLKRELVRAQEEIKRIQSVPLVIGQFMEAIDQKYVFANIPHRSSSNKSPAPALYNHQQVLIMSCASYQLSTVRSLSHLPQSHYTATRIPSWTSSLPKPTPLLLC